ncbi:CLUMA_CG012360, isoform A [Clunio marinus]|uniref:CLUMA_CG012360, isoform A n=1 Tax=Clunio marinus TaxID=568069 RepID=A0A1J1IKI0_9DIPT|nr:CLUMA_CG012360, isoform A [Clunio marinus]
MKWSEVKRLNPFNYSDRYRNHQKLVVCRYYIVYFLNTKKHIEDIEPKIRQLMVTSNFEPDVVFIVDEIKFPAHKRILKISCEQFYIEHVERNENSLKIILDNVNPRGFQQFLRFCHFGDVNLNPLNMMQTYDVAQTYNNSTLIAFCTEFICNNVDESNVLEILDWILSHQQQNYQLMRFCRGFIIENVMKVLEIEEQFAKITKRLLKMILSLEVLNCSEMFLFQKTLEWAEEECKRVKLNPTQDNKKIVLEDILYLIRLELTEKLEVLNDFPTSSRMNYFTKRRFDNLYIEDSIQETIEEVPATNEDVTCHGLSVIISNPKLERNSNEHFIMTIDNSREILMRKEFNVRASEYLAIKDFVFEEPIIFKKFIRHFVKVEFINSNRQRYLGKDDSMNNETGRILRLYD